MHKFNHSSCRHVGIICLFEHATPCQDCGQMDKLLLLPGFFPFKQKFLQIAFMWLSFTWVINKELFYCVSVGMRAVPSAAGWVRATVTARRTLVQRSSMPAPLWTPSPAHPWAQDAAHLSWWAEMLHPAVASFPVLCLVLSVIYVLCVECKLFVSSKAPMDSR